MKKATTVCFLCILLANIAWSQLSVTDYQNADSTQKFRDLAYYTTIRPGWIEGTSSFWYSVNTRKGDEYFLVDASKGKKIAAFDQEKLCQSLNLALSGKFKPYSIPMRDLRFTGDLKTIEFVIDTVKWKCDLRNYRITRVETVERPGRRRDGYWGESRNELGNDPVVSPDSNWVAFIKNFNVYVRPRKGAGNEFQLSYDGSEGELYSSYMEWSPDSKKLATTKVRPHARRFFYFVESSPTDQLQAKLHTREYLKPGDAVPVRKPALFNVEEKKQIAIDSQPFENQYNLGGIEWRKDSRAYTFEFNQRGHQVYQVVEVDASDGRTTILVDERSTTFIDYSGKRIRHDVHDGEEIIWASERDGWNHLYLYDGKTGELKNRITRGEWVVRDLVHVDEKNRTILFTGSGRNRGEDPYLVHYYRINFDGTELADLTPENATHQAEFSGDRTWLVDTYSRVDMPPVTVLRRASDGGVIMELEKADISDLLEAGYRMPEVFSAKGRDGVTDIWGIIYRPTHFDPAKKYPVIESIYAGPHGSFVPKNFRPYFGYSPLAELGFILVQIDGMGTSNRSKAFHDVCWQNLKDAGFPDRILWIRAAAAQYFWMDTTRVGIFGTSAGGQSSTGALLFHPEFYKVAVSSCGCHDNRMDKIWWNEQWMGYPVGPHYSESSNVVNAHNLQGRLMLLVGEMDDNVDPASTMQVVDALIRAKRDFELVVLPGMNHTGGGEYGERKRRDFFVKHLLGYDPPDWNRVE